MSEFGIFDDQSSDYTDDQALETFVFRERAERARAEKYADYEHARVHEVEEPECDGQCLGCRGICDDWEGT